jgi:hypothetical protein
VDGDLGSCGNLGHLIKDRVQGFGYGERDLMAADGERMDAAARSAFPRPDSEHENPNNLVLLTLGEVRMEADEHRKRFKYTNRDIAFLDACPTERFVEALILDLFTQDAAEELYLRDGIAE